MIKVGQRWIYGLFSKRQFVAEIITVNYIDSVELKILQIFENNTSYKINEMIRHSLTDSWYDYLPGQDKSI